MQQRQLGSLTVSSLGLGCMGMSEFYGATDETQAQNTLLKSFDLGVTHFDTADMYGKGANETLVGKTLKPIRDQLTIATKFGIVREEGATDNRSINGSAAYVKQACDASLQRLGIDTIDLYYMHRLDASTPIEETVGAMAELVKAGKVRHLGLSEVSVEQIKRAQSVHPISAIQTEFSLMSRAPEHNGLLDYCREQGIGFVAYSPLGRGLLSNCFELDNDQNRDFRYQLPRFQGERLQQNRQLVAQLQQIADRHQASIAQIALAWILAKHAHIVPIFGARRLTHLQENLQAAELALSAEDLTAIEAALPQEKVAGKRYSDELMSTYQMED